MRRGQVEWRVVSFVLAIGILIFLVIFYGGQTKNIGDSLDGLTDCGEGLITSGLAQYGEAKDGAAGKCYSEKDCGSHTASNEEDIGYYYQYIGKGWGCPGDPEAIGYNKDDVYCCLRLPEGSNPVNFQDIRGAARAQMGEGELLFNMETKNIHTNIMRDTGVDLVVKLEEVFDFTYRPKSLDARCELEINLVGSSLKGIKITNTACNNPGESSIVELGPGRGFINIIQDNNLAPPLGSGTMTEEAFLQEINRTKVPDKQRLDATLKFTTAGGISISRNFYITT